ncbi:MAG: CoA transferase [Candidatus Binataceae bacterium]|nr:CoA transferase [Candidatus Binataceae bacterium]
MNDKNTERAAGRETEANLGGSAPTLVPKPFGPLASTRIVSTGVLVAEPFAAALAAEMGAEVIHIERPGSGDLGWRQYGIRVDTRDGAEVATNWVQERRNMFCITLDVSKPQGRALFLKLVTRADAWMENSKGATYAKLGIDDSELLALNPRLVITHVSGYGQSGQPDYIRRASYDAVGQAFGGMMYQTGFPEPGAPTLASPFTGDYITALFALWSTLAGIISARANGAGQTIDVAQFEAIHRVLGGTMVEYFQRGVVRERHGNGSMGAQPLDSYQTSDGWVVVGATTGNTFPRLCRVIGLDSADARWRKANFDPQSMEGVEFDAILRGWISERTTVDVVRLFNDAQVGCSAVMNSRDMAEDPHYKAREVHTEWEDVQAGKIKGIGIVPKFLGTPGQVWRGSVGLGYDNDLVYRKLLGLDEPTLTQLRSAQVI